MAGVRGKLADLRRSVDGGSTSECESYTAIRLATMAEQFFGIMVREGRPKDYKLNSKMNRMSSSVMGDIVRHHAGQPGFEKVNYDEGICRPYNTAANTGACTFAPVRGHGLFRQIRGGQHVVTQKVWGEADLLQIWALCRRGSRAMRSA